MESTSGKPEEYPGNAKAYFREGSFAIIRTDHAHAEAFAIIRDEKEITMIIDQDKLGNISLSKDEKDWKILTLDVVFPLDAVGILAGISGVLAEKGVSIMAISAYSRDHFLVRQKDIRKATEALNSLGIIVIDSAGVAGDYCY
jgi:hypothetical protein